MNGLVHTLFKFFKIDLGTAGQRKGQEEEGKESSHKPVYPAKKQT